MNLNALYVTLSHKHLPGKHNQKLHGRLRTATEVPAEIVALRQQRNSAVAYLNTLYATPITKYMRDEELREFAAMQDWELSEAQRGSRVTALAVLTARANVYSLEHAMAAKLEEHFTQQALHGMLPEYDLAALHAQKTSAESDEALIAAKDKLQEARAVMLVRQREDGIDHDRIANKFNNVGITDYESMHEALKHIAAMDIYGNSRMGDLRLQAINETFGLDAPPKLVSKAEMDTLIASGAKELFRGVVNSSNISAGMMNDQFKAGEFYVGVGIYGNGTYVGYGKSRTVANQFSNKSEVDGVIRMVLKSEARVVTFTDLKGIIRNHSSQMDAYLEDKARSIEEKYNSGIYAKRYTSADADAKIAELRKLDDVRFTYRQVLYSDYGRFAAAAGYDAIDTGTDYMVILNRSAVAADMMKFRISLSGGGNYYGIN